MGKTSSGWSSGFIGMLIFSGSLPATRVAVMQLDPLFLTGARAAIAGLLALAALTLFRQRRPTADQWRSLGLVSLGVVLGFPLLTALALQQVTAAHTLVFMGLLPLSTAIFGVLRGGERPQPSFWFFSLLGSALVMGFAASQGMAASWRGDLLMLLACLAYAAYNILLKRWAMPKVPSWQLLYLQMVVAM
ncbi:MAG: DMT family transporter, partial [Comamonas sp.]